MRSLARSLAAAALLAAAAPALADPLPFPEDPDAGACTVKQQQKPGETCRTCRNPRDRNLCAERQQREGYVLRCQGRCTRGVCPEVWCKPVAKKDGAKGRDRDPATVSPHD